MTGKQHFHAQDGGLLTRFLLQYYLDGLAASIEARQPPGPEPEKAALAAAFVKTSATGACNTCPNARSEKLALSIQCAYCIAKRELGSSSCVRGE